MSTQPKEVEATAMLVRRADRWFIQFHLDSGEVTESNVSFPTKQDAEAALNAYIEDHGIRRIATAQ